MIRPFFGVPFPGKKPHAVVIGASVSGLLAARVLTDYYDRVTLLDRDVFSAGSEPRKGVPQGNQIHVLLVGGGNAIASQFPGFFEELVKHGSVPVDFSTQDARWFQHGVWKKRALRPIILHSQTRPFLEGRLRARVGSLPGVTIVPSCTATGLAFDDTRSRVTGVRVRDAGQEGATGERVIEADLVVEAGGRNSSVPKWIEEAGYARPAETTVGIKMGYSTRFYCTPASGPPEWKATAVYSKAPETTKSGVIFRVEGDRWIVTLMGALGDYPPTDDPGFLEFARQLDDPAVYEWLRQAEPLTEAVPYRYPAHLRRHYSQLDRFPEGLAVCGDALCSFNPIYGQGMTAGAMEALALREALERCGRTGASLRRTYFPLAEAVVDSPWEMATGADFLHPRTEGERPPGIGFRNWYLKRLLGATARDPEVTTCFYEVLHALRKPSLLFRPDIVARILLA